jgi:hypothetical protein
LPICQGKVVQGKLLRLEIPDMNEVICGMSSSYLNRKYLKDARTGEVLSTTVMYDNDKRIMGTKQVFETLLTRIPAVDFQLGGKNLQTRDFIEAFQIRGPNYGDVVRKAIDNLVENGQMRKTNVGTIKIPRYSYSLLK